MGIACNSLSDREEVHIPQEALEALEEAQQSAAMASAIRDRVAQQSQALEQLQAQLDETRQQQASSSCTPVGCAALSGFQSICQSGCQGTMRAAAAAAGAGAGCLSAELQRLTALHGMTCCAARCTAPPLVVPRHCDRLLCEGTQVGDSQEMAARFEELSGALEEAETQLAENEVLGHRLRELEQQLQQQVMNDMIGDRQLVTWLGYRAGPPAAGCGGSEQMQLRHPSLIVRCRKRTWCIPGRPARSAGSL